MSEKIYLRPDIVDGKLMIVDQHGRILHGVFGFVIDKDYDSPMGVDLRFYAHNADGKPIDELP